MTFTISALDGKEAKYYQQIAEQFRTSPTGYVKITDFGTVKDRYPISPKIGYLARRGSEKVRLALGLSYIKHGKVHGAIFRHKLGEYQWDPDFVWPKAGEVDPAVLRAAERARLREIQAVSAKPRNHVTESRGTEVVQPELTESPESSESPVEAPVSVAEPPVVPEPTPAPVVAPEAPVAAVVECQVLADTGDLIVLRYNGNVIVAEVTTRSAVR